MMTLAPTGGASSATQMFQTSKIKIIISISLDMKQPKFTFEIISIADMIQKLVQRTTKRSLLRPVDLHAPLQVKIR